jgi:hypothetical protein
LVLASWLSIYQIIALKKLGELSTQPKKMKHEIVFIFTTPNIKILASADKPNLAFNNLNSSLLVPLDNN